ADPSWRPGEGGRSSGWTVHGRPDFESEKWEGRHIDTTRTPLYPRISARPNCSVAVRGHVVVADLASGRGTRGEVTVKVDSLVMGDTRRGLWARQAGFQS